MRVPVIASIASGCVAAARRLEGLALASIASGCGATARQLERLALCRACCARSAGDVLGGRTLGPAVTAGRQPSPASPPNAVRVPVGYRGVLPPATTDPYIGPVWTHLDDARGWAASARLGVLVDLHAHPGGRSGEAHMGRARGDRWSAENWDVETALDAVAAVAGRYGAGAAAVDGSPSGTPPALL